MARNHRLDDARQRRVGTVRFQIVVDVASLVEPPARTGQRGRQRAYGDGLVEACACLRNMTGLSLRGVEGFVVALLDSAGTGNAGRIDHTTLCRRLRLLDLRLPRRRLVDPCLVGDGTGLRLVDEGGWKPFVHGREKGKRREDHQVVIIADAETGELVELDSGPFRKGSAKETARLGRLERHAPKGCTLSWDGAGDDRSAHDACGRLGLRFIAPPDKNAATRSSVFPPRPPRTKAVRELQSIGRAAWKRKHGYPRRSLIESVNHRFKALFGSSLASRNDDARKVDVLVHARLYNATLSDEARLLIKR